MCAESKAMTNKAEITQTNGAELSELHEQTCSWWLVFDGLLKVSELVGHIDGGWFVDNAGRWRIEEMMEGKMRVSQSWLYKDKSEAMDVLQKRAELWKWHGEEAANFFNKNRAVS